MSRKIKENDLSKLGMAKCPVTMCGRIYKPTEKQKAYKSPAVCPACLKFVNQLAFWLPRIKLETGKTVGGLIVPGHKDYKVDSLEKLKGG